MEFKGGVIIVGSLFWDNEPKRMKWRQLYLEPTKNKISTKVKIRYGRQSSSRKNTYTIIFSNHPTTEFGNAFILTFKDKIKNAENLENQAYAMADAEGLWKKTEPSLNKSWGTLGLLINPKLEKSKNLEIIKERWSKIYAEYEFDNSKYIIDNEPDIINEKGFIKMNWTDEMNEFDFLIATLTVPKPKSLLSGKDIYERMNNNGYNDYFLNNRKNGIMTFQDDEISSGLK